MIKQLEEHILQSDMTRKDIMLFHTTVSFGRTAHQCTPRYLCTQHLSAPLIFCAHLTVSAHLVIDYRII